MLNGGLLIRKLPVIGIWCRTGARPKRTVKHGYCSGCFRPEAGIIHLGGDGESAAPSRPATTVLRHIGIGDVPASPLGKT